jgi:hypothetical protein
MNGANGAWLLVWGASYALHVISNEVAITGSPFVAYQVMFAGAGFQ